jgi:hypothetical protein
MTTRSLSAERPRALTAASAAARHPKAIPWAVGVATLAVLPGCATGSTPTEAFGPPGTGSASTTRTEGSTSSTMPGADAATGTADASVGGGDDAASSAADGTATTPDGGADGGGCPGVAIAPDDGGLVAAGSNTLGIHGSWFVYSDCADLNNKNCAMVTSPSANAFPNVGGKMCTSGQTSTAAGAWGAGIALELNDGPPQQPYDTTAHGVKGFCFDLSGSTIPSTTIRVAFPTQDNNDNAYFEAVSTPGVHSVLFTDIAQGSWVTTKTPFEPTKVMLLQFQIPSSTTAPVPWDFCIDGLTAITD